MESNFEFLNDKWNKLYDHSRRVEENVLSDTKLSSIFSRQALELAVNYVYAENYDLNKKYRSSLGDLITNEDFKEMIGNELFDKIMYLKNTGNKVIHNKDVVFEDPLKIVKFLYSFIRWFFEEYGNEDINLSANIDVQKVKDLAKNHKHDIQELQEINRKLEIENKLEIKRHKNEIESVRKQNEELKFKLLQETKTRYRISKEQHLDLTNENLFSYKIHSVIFLKSNAIHESQVYLNLFSNDKKYCFYCIGFNDDKGYEITEDYIREVDGGEHFNNLDLFESFLSKRYNCLLNLFRENILIELDKVFAFDQDSRAYEKNGHYKIGGNDYMSIWAYKKNRECPTENTTENNRREGLVLLSKNVQSYNSTPDFGEFRIIKIYSVSSLKKFYTNQFTSYCNGLN